MPRDLTARRPDLEGENVAIVDQVSPHLRHYREQPDGRQRSFCQIVSETEHPSDPHRRLGRRNGGHGEAILANVRVEYLGGCRADVINNVCHPCVVKPQVVIHVHFPCCQLPAF